MDKYRELGERLRGLHTKSASLYQGIVRRIEGRSCTVEIDGLEIPDVRMRASLTEEDEELLITPAIGSVVIAGSLSGDLGDLVILSVDRAERITLFGGKRGGLVLAPELTKRLNAIEDDLSRLKQVFASWVTVPSDGGASLKAATASWATSPIEKTQVRHIATPKIIQ